MAPAPPAIDRLDHLVLTVRDVGATCAFYRRVLGMEVLAFGDNRTALRFGRQKINLHQAGRELEPRAARPTPGSGDLCLISAEPLARWIEHLGSAGVAVELGPVRRTGARGPIDSIYLRDPDGNLVEISNEAAAAAGDELAPLRAWLLELQGRVRAADFAGGRALCAPELVAFGTVAPLARGLDAVETQQWRNVWPHIRDFTIRVEEALGAVRGDAGWIAAPWDSSGVRADGSTFARPGRLTIAFERREGRWRATHTHFSLVPAPAGGVQD